MSTLRTHLAQAARSSSSIVVAGLIAFAAYHLALALFMAIAPDTFYTQVGPFGSLNDHYIRDVATYNAAIGVALAVSVRHASWRVPILALTVLQFTLHSVNHLVDIDRAHPAWTGYFDFGSLVAATILLAWLLRTARANMTTSTAEAPAHEWPLTERSST